MINYLVLGLTLVVGIGLVYSLNRDYKQKRNSDLLTIGYLREELNFLRKQLDAQKEIYQIDMAAQRDYYRNKEVIVTDKPIVLAEEPQLEDSRYAGPKPIVWAKASNEKYPSWQPSITTGPTVSYASVWTKPKGGELLGTVRLEDTRSDIIFAKARAEAHEKIVGNYSD